ncbi:Riboflavin biosynthesis protein RibF [Tepidimonas alkaliphilus]|uniref:Riboflavin biosynthesis protein n=1 Tax=Tepidimonas alkaliphilus TaxID=2588942 RepID=A0A554W5N6_9BURK|nr:bifunctional riboflavin kinase/FAD synthetase [Tepidimonas alkaliphilus]TSE18879.1 Riboflavin biosynthesis protein RibF [Tepidimonas alkaliphilus]
MNIVYGLHNLQRQPPRARALTIGNFDGVHRGHQAMLALLIHEARQRGLPACAVTFEPHPRDFFAAQRRQPDWAPARIATLRDKLAELRQCGIDECVILPFNAQLAALSAEAFVHDVLARALQARYVLVGDDFRFGAQRRGDYALLDALGAVHGFEVARMMSFEVHGQRVSSSAVRAALANGDLRGAAALLGRPYAISGHVVHGRKLGRALGETAAGRGDGFRTLNLRFRHWKPAASGIFVVQVHGLDPAPGAAPLPGVANLGVRPSLDARDVNGGRVLLETHCLEWPSRIQRALEQAPVPGEAYGRIIRVELLHKLHDERRYPSLDALAAGIAQDCADARAWWSAHGPLAAHHEA